jgi:hypothetical protein
MGAAPQEAHAGCGLLGLEPCPPAPALPPAPDPGGDEAADVALPLGGGKALGFNTALFSWDSGVPAAREVEWQRALGATLQRYAIHWRGMQRDPGEPPLPDEGGKPVGQLSHQDSGLARLDAIYLELVAQGMTPVIVVFDAPPWATPYASCGLLDLACHQARNSPFLHPDRAHLPDWARFVAAVAARYPRAAIEPWNEPNLKAFWKPDQPSGRALAELQCAAYHAVKALPQPNAVISAGITAMTERNPPPDGSPTYERYMEDAYSAGLAGCMDALSVHTYPGNHPRLGEGSMLAAGFAAIRDLRARHGDTSRIWVTETGTSSYQAALLGGGDQPLTEAQQADVNTRLLNRLATMPDVDVVVFHTLRNRSLPQQAGTPQDPETNFGFRRENGSAKPVFCAFALKARNPC